PGSGARTGPLAQFFFGHAEGVGKRSANAGANASPRSTHACTMAFGSVFPGVFFRKRFCRALPKRFSESSFRSFGAVVPPPGLEKFSARLLTSENPVISFRPAHVNRGSE